MTDKRDPRRLSSPFGYPTKQPLVTEKKHSRVLDDDEARDTRYEREDTGVIRDPLQLLLARSKNTSHSVAEMSELLRAIVEERAAELQRAADRAHDEAELEQRERESRRRGRLTLIASVLGVIVPTLVAIAALIAALHGNPAPPIPAPVTAPTEVR